MAYHSKKRLNIDLDGRTLAYTLKQSRKARYARLEVRPGEGLCVILPHTFQQSYAEKFINAKKRWIFNKLDTFSLTEQERLLDGQSVMYLGKRLRVITQLRLDSQNSVSFNNNTLIVSATSNDEKSVILEKWLKQQAERIVTSFAKEYSPKIGVCYEYLRFCTAQTRWGSCSQRGTLSFNWKLIATPPEIIRYVVIHELCHLSELNHSVSFWKLVQKHCPEWKEYRKWLKINSYLLSF